MQEYQQQFIEFCLEHQVLQWGEFTLKSQRISPYFFNLGVISSGDSLAKLGEFYAEAIQAAKIAYDMLFGPAYKGIVLASSTAIALSQRHNKNIPICFNRKEAKDHGEKGQLIGHPLTGQVLIIDDVLTAGTAFDQAREIITAQHAELAGLCIALNRQECVTENHRTSALKIIAEKWHIPTLSIINLEHIVEFLQAEGDKQALVQKIMDYRKKYGSLS